MEQTQVPGARNVWITEREILRPASKTEEEEPMRSSHDNEHNRQQANEHTEETGEHISVGKQVRNLHPLDGVAPAGPDRKREPRHLEGEAKLRGDGTDRLGRARCPQKYVGGVTSGSGWEPRGKKAEGKGQRRVRNNEEVKGKIPSMESHGYAMAPLSTASTNWVVRAKNHYIPPLPPIFGRVLDAAK
ncbi:hypothetical protein C8R47DRAFT_1075817 [Mycena vitilis]|nr:hypothetical protein C8R47DRAFT_1075817 [Mycena vitilis]